MFRKISSIVIIFSYEFTTSLYFCASIWVVFGIPGQVMFHPSMNVDGPFFVLVYVFWICWIITAVDFINHFSFSQTVALFAFLSSLSLNTCSSITLFLMVTNINSTTFTSTTIVYVSTTSSTFITATNFPWTFSSS